MVHDANLTVGSAGIETLVHNEPCSNDLRTHYSFDFAQQFTPLQPSKWSLVYVVFLVGDIRLYHNMNSLLDYEMYMRKWSKAVTSYLHNFLELGV